MQRTSAEISNINLTLEKTATKYLTQSLARSRDLEYKIATILPLKKIVTYRPVWTFSHHRPLDEAWLFEKYCSLTQRQLLFPLGEQQKSKQVHSKYKITLTTSSIFRFLFNVQQERNHKDRIKWPYNLTQLNSQAGYLRREMT